MHGMSRTVAGDKVESFEFMRIQVVDGKAAFLVQPNGVPPTAFALADQGDGWVRFEHSAHDFPDRIEYRRVDGGLRAQISGPGAGGKTMTIPFAYRRCEG